jgi:processive 1,2-diacylglycerol beta-glucosyltransferase
MAPRVLILTASVGGGHNRAAEAVELALREICPQALVRTVDVLTLTNAAFRRFYGKTYFDVVAAAPHLVRYLYDRLDKPMGRLESVLDRLRFAFQHANLGALYRLLTAQPWDLAISTHFLPAEIVASLRRQHRVSFPHATVTTDFDSHRLWCNLPCEHFFTATEESKINMAALGALPKRITASGIPVHPVFSKPRNGWECKRVHGLYDDRPVILQAAGGFGVGPIDQIHRQIVGVETPMQIVVVAGRNRRAMERIESIPCPSRHRRVVLGYTNEMDELMAAAEIIISKPGGLTSSEALCRGTAMIIVDPIPGQEDRNSDYLLENGAAVKVNNFASLGHKLATLLESPARLDQIRSAARRLARPRAAYDVAKRSLQLINADFEWPRSARQESTPPAMHRSGRSPRRFLWQHG